MSSSGSKLYKGRKALITGGASGIGKRLAEHLLDNGAVVVCSDINEKLGRTVVAEWNKRYSSEVAFFVKCDVTSWESVVALFKTAEKILKSKLDFVFPNAGVIAVGYPNNKGKPNIASLSVNLIGVVYTVQAAINHFRAHKTGGSIIVTGSQASINPYPGEPLYAAGKFGVLGLVRSVAPLIEGEKIYLNAVGPGSVATPLVPKDMLDEMNANGFETSIETAVKAFSIFLEPGCTLSGQFAEALNDRAYLHTYPVYVTANYKLQSKL